MSGKHARNLLVWLHVVTSVAWFSQALALLALLLTGMSASSTEVQHSAYSMAQVLDKEVLMHMANAAIFSGLMLSALTPWGYFQYWWVVTKFVITITQLYVAIFLLSPTLDAMAEAAAQGEADSPHFLIIGTIVMASAIDFQAWMSVAKPWKRTPWSEPKGRPKRLPTGSSWMFLFCVCVPLFDYLHGKYVLGFPLPLMTLLTAIGYPFWRAHVIRQQANDRTVLQTTTTSR